MTDLSLDIIGKIFEYLPTKDVVLASWTCKKFMKAFKQNIWRFHINLNPYFNKLENRHLKYFKGVKHISLFSCRKITSFGLSYLKDVDKIDLSFCNNISEGLKYLEGVKEISLSWSNVTDVGLKYLKNCDIDIVACTKITKEGIKLLKANNKKVISSR